MTEESFKSVALPSAPRRPVCPQPSWWSTDHLALLVTICFYGPYCNGTYLYPLPHGHWSRVFHQAGYGSKVTGRRLGAAILTPGWPPRCRKKPLWHWGLVSRSAKGICHSREELRALRGLNVLVTRKETFHGNPTIILLDTYFGVWYTHVARIHGWRHSVLSNVIEHNRQSWKKSQRSCGLTPSR